MNLPKGFKMNDSYSGPATARPSSDTWKGNGLVAAQDAARLPPDIEDAYPVSMLQAGTFFHTEFSESGRAYHELFSYLASAPLERRSLVRALSLLVARHPILRTSFDFGRFSVPIQLVHPTAAISLEVEEGSSSAAQSPEAHWHLWLGQQLLRPLVWDRAPLMRIGVKEWSHDEFQLSFLFHHALMDAWSFQRFLAQLMDYYERCFAGEPITEPTSNSAFREFIRMERKSIASEASRGYWRSYLAGAPSGRFRDGFLEKHEVSSRGKAQARVRDTAPSARVRQPVPERTSARLVRLAGRWGVSMRSVLLAAHSRVLRELIGSDDVITGLITECRPQTAEAQSSLGLFQNTVPFRLDASPRAPWSDLVRRASICEAEVTAHSRLPLAVIQNQLGGPPFHAIVTLIEGPAHPTGDRVGIRISEVGTYGEISVPLAVTFTHDPGARKLELSLTYDRIRLPRDRVAVVAGRYAATLETLAEVE